MKNNKLPRPISILILTLLTTVVWVSLTVYRSITTGPSSSVPENISQALTPTLNKDFIGKIESAIFLDDSQIPQQIANPSVSPVPTVTPLPLNTPTPIATSSALPTTTP